MKWRNSKERELLANGGSRDQTLPNKNNPNPDLSDAKCDRLSVSPSPPPSLTTDCTILTMCSNVPPSSSFIKSIERTSPANTSVPASELNTIPYGPNSVFNRQQLNNFEDKPSKSNGVDQRLYYDDFEDSNSDSDEEISVT
uniref:Homeobox domain-containing protein n=1 Tax=Megaselia scalaris TaxID=36166 RepID=T1GWG7_MEGSC